MRLAESGYRYMHSVAKTNRRTLVEDLGRLGVTPGNVLMVHASLRSVGPIVGGANVLVEALLDSIGPDGTLTAYVDFEPFFDDRDDPAAIPVFDKRTAPAARDHGVLHETIRNWPGALRSDHPDAGVVAIGRLASWVTGAHPFRYGYGEGTPFERIMEASGRVLMIGAPLDTITLLHNAEHRANLPGKRIVRYRRLMPSPHPGGEPEWVEFEEFDTSDPVCDFLPPDCFTQIAQAFIERGGGRRGKIGQAESFLLDAQQLVPFAIDWLERFAASR